MIVREAMTAYFASAHNSSTLGDSMDKMLRERPGILYVVPDKSNILGSINEKLLMHVIDNPQMRVEPAIRFMDRKVSSVKRHDNLVRAAQLFQQTGVSELPVVEENKLVGVLTVRQMLRAIFRKSWTENLRFQTV